MNSSQTVPKLRVDKWLWAARFYKTRSLAVQAIGAGHVRVNGQRCKPAREIAVGDRIEVGRGNLVMEVIVSDLSSSRGSAPIAQRLYQETAESTERRVLAARQTHNGSGAAPGERPTKRDRRRLDRWHDEVN